MRQSILTGVSTVALLLSVSAASAADLDPVAPAVRDSGWYISLFAGLNLLEDFENDYVYGGAYDAFLETDEGFAFGGAIGRRVWGNFRADVEVTYANNNADSFVFSPNGGTFAVTGDVDSLTALGNLWYDLDTGTIFTPYIGGGAGLGVVWGDYNYDPCPACTGQIVHGSDVGFAFQAGAGVNVALSESFDLTFGYRFRGILDLSLESTFPGAGSGNKHGDYFAHTFIGGITWKFPGLY